MTGSTGSSMSHLESRRSPIRFSFGGLEWSRPASHLLSTRREERYRKACEKNPVEARKNGAHSAVDCVQCRSLHHGGNKPADLSILSSMTREMSVSYPHRSMERSSDFIILLQPGTATKNLGQPELTNSSLHMSNLSLGWSGCLDPLGWLSSNTAHHVGMREGLGGSLLRLDIESRRNWLGDPGVQRRGSAWDDQVLVSLVASSWTTFAVSGPWTDERRVVIK